MICKFQISSIYYFIYMRFILTMWYVNIFDTLIKKIIITSFILTMWYVNGVMSLVNASAEEVLY